MARKNLILDSDSYKFSHWRQYPPGITNVSSYIEARVGGDYDDVVFFGLQAWLRENLSEPVTATDVLVAKGIIEAHGEPFNYDGWMRIVQKHGGYLPLKIQAIPEGTVLPPGNVLVQVTNTDPALPWLTSFVETSLLRGVWYPTTVASRSRKIKEIILAYLCETGTPESIAFKLHDFGCRGVSSYESAKIGGLAHLVNFMGTDTVPAILGAQDWYEAGAMPAFSIPAAEHSTICAWGRDREADAYQNMLQKFGGPGKLVAVVSDTYDIQNAVTEIWGKQLRNEVINSGGTLVVRPDSGEPCEVVLDVIERLGAAFGFSTNSKGYKVLPDFVRVIQGDGVNEESIDGILWGLSSHGWSADNVAFGMGGELLQTPNRDTLRFAMKASAISDDNGRTWTGISKNPVGDSGKKSKAGRLALVQGPSGEFVTVDAGSDYYGKDLLETVYEDGVIVRRQSLKSIRELAARGL